MKYIDISEWQGEIDWAAVRQCVDGVILRAGYGKNNADRQFARNAAECSRLGIPFGAYWFSYAKSVDEAKAEAGYLLAAVKPYRTALPLVFDFEYDSVRHAALQGVTVTKALASDMARAFLSAVEAGGHWAMLYANPDFLARYFDGDLPQRYALWLASWTKRPDLSAPPRPDCAIWQWTSTGSVPGIAGSVDVSESYRDFAALIGGEESLPLEDLCRLGKHAGGMLAGTRGAERQVPSDSEADEVESNDAAAAATPHQSASLTAVAPGEAVGAGVPDGPPASSALSAAMAWAAECGILPAGAAPEDTATLAAAAEMFLNYHRAFGGEA